MKIGLYCKHAGLIDVLSQVLGQHHEVRLKPRWDYYPRQWQGDEDVIITTLPYDFESLEVKKPTIVYYTDPTFPENQKRVQELFDAGKVEVIGAEDCYPDDLFISGVKKFIPFALNKKNYPPYTGFRPQVSIVNRKPIARWLEVIRGATGLGMSFDQYLKFIPYEIIDEPDTHRFRLRYAEDRVLFYYSNSPYTIVLFEAMTVGMPIVAFNHHHRSKSSVIEKYIPAENVSIDQEYIQKRLQFYLQNKPEKPVEYPNLPKFDDVVNMWEEVLKKYEQVAEV